MDPLIISEKVWFGYGGIPLLKEKTEQIIFQLKNLGAVVPELFQNQKELFRRIKRMLNKNRFYRTGLINIQIMITNTETYFFLFATPHTEMEFKYFEKGVLVSLTDIQKQSKNILQTKMDQARFINLLAAVKSNDVHTQNFVFLNEKGMVCDAGLANIYFIQKNVLITPSLETGCITDNLRSLVLEASKKIGLEINESAEVDPESIYIMNEIFFAAEATGIQWVLGKNNKRFVHSVSLKIHKELNTILKSMVI
jgi:branched-chain amino acid aminotransferase